MKQKLSKRFIVVLGSVILIFLIGVYVVMKPQPPLKDEVVYIEAGENCELSIQQFEQELSENDKHKYTSNINCNKLGMYEAEVTVKKLFETKTFSYKIEVGDSIAPEIKVRNKIRTIEAPSNSGENVCVLDFNERHIEVKDNFDLEPKILFDNKVNTCEVGEHSLTISAIDKEGNKSEVKLTFEVTENQDRFMNGNEIVINIESLSLRFDPRDDAKIIDTVYDGETYEVLDQAHDAYNRLWLKVEVDGVMGYLPYWHTIRNTTRMRKYHDASRIEVGQMIEGYKVVDHHFDLIERSFVTVQLNKWVGAKDYYIAEENMDGSITLEEKILNKYIAFRSSPNYIDMVDSSNFDFNLDKWNPHDDNCPDSNENSEYEFYIANCTFKAFDFLNATMVCEVLDYRKKN